MDPHPDRPRALGLALAGLLVGSSLSACMKPNPLLYTLAEDDGGTSTETGAGETEETTGEAETEDSGSEQQPDLGGGDSCEPFELYEPMCDACLADSCCALALACAADSVCLCVLDCKLTDTPPGQCKQSCGAKPAEVPAHVALVDCRKDACADSC